MGREYPGLVLSRGASGIWPKLQCDNGLRERSGLPLAERPESADLGMPAPLKGIAGSALGRGNGASRRATFAGAGRIKGVSDKAVFILNDEGLQALPKPVEILVIQPALKDALLDADAEVEAGLGDTPEAFGTGNVVNNDAEHFLYARRRRVRAAGQQVFPPIFGDGVHTVQLSRKGASNSGWVSASLKLTAAFWSCCRSVVRWPTDSE